MGKKSGNSDLKIAKSLKKDEFYTCLNDIKEELEHYKKHFKGQIVYCNCDDPRESNFAQYFIENFNQLGLEKLIISCYKNRNYDLYNQKYPERAFYVEYCKIDSLSMIDSIKDSDIRYFDEDGDFRSKECIELLKQATIVVTNPPFSLFREYVAQLIEYKKKFLIIGNVNALTYKDIFKLILNGEIWLGKSIHSGDREFRVPNDYPLNASGFRVDSLGSKFIRVKGVRWFTNLDYTERYTDIILTEKYSINNYPKYDNYEAIDVNKVKNIPFDYDGILGVPITFIDKYNPMQFEILGLSASAGYDKNIVGIPLIQNGYKKDARPTINGRTKFARIFIKKRY